MSVMSKSGRLFGIVIVLAMIGTSPAHADEEGPPEPSEVARCKFSGKRLFVEILAGSVASSLAAYGTYSLLCSEGEDCFLPAMAGLMVGFAVTPPVEWATGNAMGGRGSLGYSYAGGAVAFAAFSGTGPVDETPDETLQRIRIELAVATIALPITTGILYELTSHVRSVALERALATGEVALRIAPSIHDRRVDGATATVGLRF